MVFLIFLQNSQAGADIHSDDVEGIFGTLELGFYEDNTIGRESISHLGQISEAGDELGVVVDHRVLDVKVEDLPDRVEEHRDDEGLRETEREPLRGDGARDDVPSLEVAGQGLQ